jgi:hypothetical protein
MTRRRGSAEEEASGAAADLEADLEAVVSGAADSAVEDSEPGCPEVRGGFAAGGFRGGMPGGFRAGMPGGGFRNVGWAGGRWANANGRWAGGRWGGRGWGWGFPVAAGLAGWGWGWVAGRFGRLSSGRNIVCRGIGANPTKTIIRFIFNTLCICR